MQAGFVRSDERGYCKGRDSGAIRESSFCFHCTEAASCSLFLSLEKGRRTDFAESIKIVPDRKLTDPSKQAQDEELGENLWRLSQRIIQEKLGSVPDKPEL